VTHTQKGVFIMSVVNKSVAIASLILTWVGSTRGYTVAVSSSPPPAASDPIPEAFVSYSIEFSSFPDFAGIGFLLGDLMDVTEKI
jgi:hypothetical protein